MPDKSLKANDFETCICHTSDGEKEEMTMCKTVTEMTVDEDKHETEEYYDMIVKYGPTYEFDH